MLTQSARKFSAYDGLSSFKNRWRFLLGRLVWSKNRETSKLVSLAASSGNDRVKNTKKSTKNPKQANFAAYIRNVTPLIKMGNHNNARLKHDTKFWIAFGDIPKSAHCRRTRWYEMVNLGFHSSNISNGGITLNNLRLLHCSTNAERRFSHITIYVRVHFPSSFFLAVASFFFIHVIIIIYSPRFCRLFWCRYMALFARHSNISAGGATRAFGA